MNEPNSSLPKVYLYSAGTFGGGPDQFMVAVAEDGTGLAQHICSSAAYGRHDLHDHPTCHATYAEKFGGWGAGEFYDLVEVAAGEAPPDHVMDAIRRKNAEAEASR